VPDVAPPLDESPTFAVARRFGVRVDLRGKDRFPLDLSRNLTEGGHERLWETVVPKFWAGMVMGGLHMPLCHQVFSEMVQAEYTMSFGQRVALIGPHGSFQLLTLPSSLPNNLTLCDVYANSLGKLATGSDACLVLPEMPEPAQLFTADPDDLDDLASPLALDASPWAKARRFWELRGGVRHTYDDERILSQPVTAAAFPNLLDALTEYVHVQHTTHGIVLMRSAIEGSFELKSLGLLRLSKNWWLVRNPCDGSWTTFGDVEASLVQDSLKTGSTLAHFALALLYDLWAEDIWHFGWPNTRKGWLEQQRNKGRRVARETENSLLREQRKKRRDANAFESSDLPDRDSTGRFVGKYQDDEEEEGVQNDEFESEPDSPEKRRHARHGAHADSLVAAFVQEILDVVDWDVINRGLTPWDMAAYDEEVRRRKLPHPH
jgi:hypothetical protein